MELVTDLWRKLGAGFGPETNRWSGAYPNLEIPDVSQHQPK